VYAFLGGSAPLSVTRVTCYLPVALWLSCAGPLKKSRHVVDGPRIGSTGYLGAYLGFPLILPSLVFGFDRYDLRPSSARALWVLSVVADLAGLVAFGSAWGWW
jgi:hypothetical protein